MVPMMSSPACRGMQPSNEKHLHVKRDSGGRLSVQDVDCTRVYHVNTVMEIRTQVCHQAHRVCQGSCSLIGLARSRPWHPWKSAPMGIVVESQVRIGTESALHPSLPAH